MNAARLHNWGREEGVVAVSLVQFSIKNIITDPTSYQQQVQGQYTKTQAQTVLSRSVRKPSVSTQGTGWILCTLGLRELEMSYTFESFG